ncbi:MAG TPA: hypothetical protein V6D50_16690 [Chroococcales cyanobacterium]
MTSREGKADSIVKKSTSMGWGRGVLRSRETPSLSLPSTPDTRFAST